MLPSPSELKYFLEVAQTLNMSRAAERLGVSQPALTLAIRRLEDNLGQAVLIRSKTGVRLTRPGQKLVSQARFLMEEWEKIREQALEEESEVHGVYSVGCHPSVALYTLPHFTKKMMSENSRLELKLYHDLSRKITEEVISCRIDFGLVINPVPHPDLVIKQLITDDVTLWVGPKKTDLQKTPAVLICDPDLLQSQSLLKQLNKKGFKFERTITSSSLEVITSLVASGAGVGILPTRVALKEKSLGLKPLSKDMPKFHDKCCLIYRADTQKTAASKKLVQLMAEAIKKNG